MYTTRLIKYQEACVGFRWSRGSATCALYLEPGEQCPISFPDVIVRKSKRAYKSELEGTSFKILENLLPCIRKKKTEKEKDTLPSYVISKISYITRDLTDTNKEPSSFAIQLDKVNYITKLP